MSGCPHEAEIARLKEVIVDLTEERLSFKRRYNALRHEYEVLRSIVPEKDLVEALNNTHQGFEALEALGLPKEAVEEMKAKAIALGIDPRNITVLRMPDIPTDDKDTDKDILAGVDKGNVN